MKLIVTEKNIAAEKLAEILADTKPKSDKVYATPVYRFVRDGEECVAIGLKGHILGVDFPSELNYKKSRGWKGIDSNGEMIPAYIPDALAKPPFTKRKPFTADGIDLTQWKMPALPYLVYAPLIKTPAEKEIIRALKNLARKADSIIIATDFDREGELIGFDAQSLIKADNPQKAISRVRYSAITHDEITHAFENPTLLDEDLAKSGESRQYIDLIWGAVLTRYLTIVKRAGMNSVRSAGRVQTPALALISKRERERLAFIPEDYWVIKGYFQTDVESFVAVHEKERFKDETQAQAAMTAIEGCHTGRISSIDKKSRKVSAPTPFNTTSLQAAAAAEGISPARTMRIAETLYMNGLTSYPRVDNTVYPASLDLAGTLKTLCGVPAFAPYAKALLAAPSLTPTRGKKETTDHPPIYPTGAGNPDKLKPEEWKLYSLISRRFMATLSDAAIVENTKVVIDVASQRFTVRGDTLVKPGFRAIYPYGLKKDETLPPLEEGQEVEFLRGELIAKQTEPPARYSQGKLIQKMEECALGTKSTRHSIIERLYDVHYIQNDPIEPTALGLAICDALEKFAPHITSPDMTAQLEEEMSSIAAGNVSQEDVVNHSRELLAQIVDDLLPRKEEMGAAIADAVTADSRVGPCPKCGKDLLVKSSAKTRSNFVGCSGWPDCDVVFPLPQGKLEPTDKLCPACGTPQIKVTPFRSKPQLLCLDPKCEMNYEPDVPIGSCPVCASNGKDGKLVAQRSPRTLKRFIRCTNYDECQTSYPLPQKGALSYEGEVCESCGSPVVIIKNGRNPWHLCVNMSCPAKEEQKQASGTKKTNARGTGSKKRTTGSAKRTTAKKTAPKNDSSE